MKKRNSVDSIRSMQMLQRMRTGRAEQDSFYSFAGVGSCLRCFRHSERRWSWSVCGFESRHALNAGFANFCCRSNYVQVLSRYSMVLRRKLEVGITAAREKFVARREVALQLMLWSANGPATLTRTVRAEVWFMNRLTSLQRCYISESSFISASN